MAFATSPRSIRRITYHGCGTGARWGHHVTVKWGAASKAASGGKLHLCACCLRVICACLWQILCRAEAGLYMPAFSASPRAGPLPASQARIQPIHLLQQAVKGAIGVVPAEMARPAHIVTVQASRQAADRAFLFVQRVRHRPYLRRPSAVALYYIGSTSDCLPTVCCHTCTTP